MGVLRGRLGLGGTAESSGSGGPSCAYDIGGGIGVTVPDGGAAWSGIFQENEMARSPCALCVAILAPKRRGGSP